MLAWRNAPDPQAYAEFLMDSGGGRAFNAKFGGRSWTCNATPGTLFYEMWPIAMMVQGHFDISWSSDGKCDTLKLSNGSQYQRSEGARR